MASHPPDLRYTEQHEWVRVGDRMMTVGITERASEHLGPIGFVSLAYPGELVLPGKMIGRLSSDAGTAVVSMPFTGSINVVNESLSETPGLINSDPYGAGWLVQIEAGDPAAADELMDAEAYEAFLNA